MLFVALEDCSLLALNTCFNPNSMFATYHYWCHYHLSLAPSRYSFDLHHLTRSNFTNSHIVQLCTIPELTILLCLLHNGELHAYQLHDKTLSNTLRYPSVTSPSSPVKNNNNNSPQAQHGTIISHVSSFAVKKHKGKFWLAIAFTNQRFISLFHTMTPVTASKRFTLLRVNVALFLPTNTC